jgi:hypothetical protein
MKTIISFLAVMIVAGLRIQADDSTSRFFRPTLEGDDHDEPVYTSPTNMPSAGNQPDAKALPVITNLPPMTNWPATNIPALTNPPPLQPPRGLTVVP